MKVLIVGGSASGKSEWAERTAVRLGEGPRIYVATMRPWDEECLARIARHRQQRAGRGFATEERYTSLSGLRLPQGSTALIECLSNLTANEMFDPDGAGEEGCVRAVVEGIESIAAQCAHTVVVSNEVFCDGAQYDPGTRKYLLALARINRELARRFDVVAEAVYGCVILHKGEEQCAFLKP